MRKVSLLLIAACLTALSILAVPGQASQNASEVIQNRAPLQPSAFYPLPLGAVKPLGWLRRQEELQAAGLTGHLDEFWADVGPNSGWLGGTGESWERGPYYLDGLLPLAYQLGDRKLIEKTQQWVDWTLRSQKADGQFGPPSNDDWWPRMVMLKVLTQYQEVTGDVRVIPFLTNYLRYELTHLPARPLREWGKYRWQDNVSSVLWLYNRTGAPELLDLAHLLHQQGYDWEAMFSNFPYLTKQTKASVGLNVEQKELPSVAMQTHGVNNAMALKAAPVWWLLSGQQSDRSELDRQLTMLDRYHGLPNGIFSADEHLAGSNPSQGTELCTVVETMFSYEQDFAILGDSHLADHLERVAYNALPATLSNDMWSHQYDQQPNQISCSRAPRQWSTNGPDSNLFGLAPHFGCCTANFHQGWPKFVSALWMATADGGLAAVAYAPSEAHTTVNGNAISIVENTAYPFRGNIQLTVHAESPAAFPLLLRIPEWASAVSVKVNGQTAASSAGSETPARFISLRRDWKNGDIVTIDFPMEIRLTHWYHNSAAFERGPLVFSLPLEAKWKEIKKYTDRSGDWEVEASRPWNYAVVAEPCNAIAKEQPVDSVPFNVDHPAVSIQIKGRRLPDWKIENNSAGDLPISPVTSDQPIEMLTLIPYGAAKLRLTAFPSLNQPANCSGLAAPTLGSEKITRSAMPSSARR